MIDLAFFGPNILVSGVGLFRGAELTVVVVDLINVGFTEVVPRNAELTQDHPFLYNVSYPVE